MDYAKKMFLVTPEEYAVIKGENQIKNFTSPDQEIKDYHEQFLKQKMKDKISEDQNWEKLERRISPILQTGLKGVKDQGSKVSDEDWQNTVSEILDSFGNPTFKNRARDLLFRLRRVPGLKISDKEITYGNSKGTIDVVDIISELVHAKKRLSNDLNELLQILKNNNFPTSLIYNQQALSFLKKADINISTDDSHLHYTDASIGTPMNKSTPMLGKKPKTSYTSYSRGARKGHGGDWADF
jgi:hypothetical protein|tara:strand:+ start:1495 stop:2214 length:720 start_codon:yes stop_codon:yes gene_type:complete